MNEVDILIIICFAVLILILVLLKYGIHKWEYVKFEPPTDDYDGKGRWCTKCGRKEVGWLYPGSPSLGDFSEWRWVKTDDAFWDTHVKSN